jgi:uncharacterized repeat protein (TIGR01451 family)
MIKLFTSKNSTKGKYFPQIKGNSDLAEFSPIRANSVEPNCHVALDLIEFQFNSPLKRNLNHSNTKRLSVNGKAAPSINKSTSSRKDNHIKSSQKIKGVFAKLAAFLITLFTFSSSALLGQDIDLAISQTINNSLPQIGDPIKYTIYLINQSTNVATGISVNSQTPYGAISGVSSTVSGGTTNYNSGDGIFTWTVPSLPGGDSLKLEIFANVGATGVFFNIAQVMAADQYDIDSEPANNILYEDDISSSCYSVPIEWFPGDEYIVSIPALFNNGSEITWFKDGVEVDGNTIGASVNPSDSTLTIASAGNYTFETSVSTCPSTGCCAIIIIKGDVFDLALKKTIIGTGPFTAPGLVTYNLEVINQGDYTATFVNLVDYVPTGLTLLSNNWTMNGLNATYDQQLSLLPKTSTNIQITFAINSNATGDIRNEAEIASAKGPGGIDVTDIDSYLDNINGNDGTAINNEVDQEGKLGGDEDDNDFEVFSIQTRDQIFDLALRKTLTTTGPYTPGSLVRYKIELINQGELDASFVKVVDIIPPGLTLTDINWSQDGDTLTYYADISLAANSSTDIFVSFEVAENATSGTLRNNVEIASAKGPSGEDVIDIDSTPDKNLLNDGPQSNDVINENGKLGGDEDDSDYAEIVITAPIFDLAINKAVATQGPFSLGQTITYNIQIQNQGEVDATSITIADYVPAGLILADNNWAMQSGKAVYNTPINLKVTQGIVTIPIIFTIDNNFTGTTIQNKIEITAAKGPNGVNVTDDDSTPNNNSTDEDDDDIEIITVNQFAAIGNFVWNDTNKNGIQDNNEVGIQGVLITLQKPNDSFVASLTSDTTGFYKFDNLAPGDYVVLFDKPSGHIATNVNQGTVTTDSDANPMTGKTGIINLTNGEYNDSVDAGFYADDVCHDIVTISATVSDICVGDTTYLRATTSNISAISWYYSSVGGSPIFVTNSGVNQMISPTTTTTYYAQLASTPSNCPNPRVPVVVVVNARPSTPSCGSPIEVCQGEFLNLNNYIYNAITTPGGVFEWHISASSNSALVPNPTAVGPGKYYLFEKSGAGCYSNPAIATVVEKPCDKFIDLSLIKVADNRNVNLNDIITYTITIANAGPDIATNIKTEDILPAGLSFVSSTDFTLVSGILKSTIATLGVNQTKVLTYKARAIGYGNIINVAEIASVDQSDLDSTPGNASNTNEDDDDDEIIRVSTPNPIADLSLQKLVSNNSPSEGDLISYTIRVTNSGPSAATNVEIKDIIPTGLNYSTSTGGDLNAFASNTVTASFNNIPSGSTVQFTISAIVTATSGTVVNRAEVTKSDQADPDSTPGSGADEDDDDSVTITVTTGCNPVTPIINSNLNSICLSQSATLTAVGCNGTVEWSNNQTGTSITVSPTNNTSYTAHCKVSTCVSTESNIVSIIVSNPATPTITALNSNICSGEEVTITATSCGGTINWSNGMTGSSINVTPSVTTTYTATCTNGSCSSIASNSVTVVVGSSQTPTITASANTICLGNPVTLSVSNCSGNVVWNSGATTSSITVNPTATTTYSVSCGTGTCSGTAFKTIAVGSGQTPNISASKESICGGGSVTLTVNNCSSNISWSTGATTNTITVSPTATTTYTVLCGTGNCSGSASKTINVGTTQTPVISASKNNICGGEAVTLTATGCFDGISWNTGQTTASITVSPSATTTYTATCGGTCGASGSKEIIVSGAGSAPTISASIYSLCEPGSVALIATGCNGTVNWSNGMTGATVNVNITANAIFTATCSNGTCISGNSNTLNITIGTLQTPSISASGSKVCAGSAVTLTASNCSGTIQWSSGQTGASISASPVVQTTYTAVCILGSCTSGNSNSVMIEIISAPNAPVISCSAARICPGESLTLNGLGCEGTVKWSTGQIGSSITISPTTTTVYTATCMIGSCESQISAPTTINVGNPFPPQLSCQNTLICLGASTTIEAAGCVGTTVWNTGQTGSVITVTPTQMTSYSAICKGSTCESEKSNVVTIGVSGNSITAPTITSLTNSCPTETVSLINGVTSSPKTSGGSFVFRTANSPNSPAVANPTSIASSGSFFVFENGGNGCYSAGAQIDVAVIACETNVDCINNPATAYAGKDTTICLNEDFFTLGGVIGGSAQSGTWTTSGTGTFSNATSLTAKYHYSLQDVNNGSVTLTLSTNDPDGSGNCTKASSSFNLSINAVNTKPTISTSKSPIICLGDSVTLTVNETAAAYLWSTGATTKSIVVKTLGDYTVKLINALGCCSLNSDILEVTNMGGIAGPTVNDLAKNICPVTSVNLISHVTSTPKSNGGIFEFHTGITPSSPMLANVSAMPTGDYYVFEKSTLGCYSNPSKIKVIIDNCDINNDDAEVGILITGNKSSVSIGDEVIYTIKVINNGPSAATNVAIENIILTGLEIVGTTPGLSVSGSNLIATIASLALNETKTYVYTAKVVHSGVVSNIAKIVALDQTDPIKSNNISQWDVECSSCQAICIATSLNAKKELQSNGSYNIKFTSLVQNCGNVELTGVGLKTNMAEMFGSTATFTMIQQPTVNAGSALTPNVAYNGGTDLNIITKSSSILSISDIDTVMWVINLVSNGTEGPYSTNAIASGVGLNIFGTASEVGDISNDGLTVLASSSTPTVIKLYKAPGIGLSLAIIDTVRQEDGSLNVTYQALVKNNGELALTNVIVSDTLSKTYVLPVTYTMVSAPTITGGLKANPSFNGKTDVNLTLPTSTMALGKLDTIRFVVNVSPNTLTKFINQAIAQGTGTLTGGGTEMVQDISNTGYNPDAPGDEPTELNLSPEDTQSVQTPCIGAALYVSENTKLADGSFDITYTSILRNCGNVNLTTISLCDTLGADFSAPSVVILKKKPSLGLSSTLALDASYNGTSNTCMLNSAISSLAPNKSDTVKWTINLTLNSNNGPFRKNVTVTAKAAAGTNVSDVSNDGFNPSPAGEDPTVLNFNNLAPDLIGISKELVSIETVGTNLYDVTFTFNVKNYGIIDFTGVQVQDNLAQTFGTNVIIDSVSIFDISQGFVANPGYTGKGLLIDLLDDSKSTLPVKTSRSLSLLVRVDLSQADTTVFENLALAIGYQNGSSTDDLSTSGSSPDPEADGTPENNSIPTIIDFGTIVEPIIETPLGIAKSVSDTIAIVDGSYQITYTVIVKNYGDTILTNVQLVDSLAAVFGDSTDFAMIGSPVMVSNGSLTLNEDYDGFTDLNFLVSGSSTLAAGVSDTITFKVKVRNNSSEDVTYSNTIYGKANSGSTDVTDKSNSGLNPDSDGDNNPGNNNVPTAITLKNGKDKNPTNVAVLIPGGISPNGDGINDKLVIEGITSSDEVSLKINNRWGELVFETDNYKLLYPGATDGWKGIANSGIRFNKVETKLPDGTYFYIAESKNQALFDGKPYYNFLTIAGGTKK